MKSDRTGTKLFRVILLVFLAAFLLPGEGAAVDFSVVEHAGQPFTVCRVDLRKDRLKLFWRDDQGQPFKRLDRLAQWTQARGRKLVFAMNGGMYHANLAPVGLFVAEGRQAVPLTLANGDGNFFLKPNGVFALTDTGARVLESSEYPRLGGKVTLATQSGPLLLRRNQLHPAINPHSTSRLFRNGVGVPSPDTAIFVISEAPVTFFELATLFRDKLHCPDALFLDGTICSLYAPELKRNDFRMGLGTILAVTE
jgi:uncharacterized protein YigE (DUF2233 family)